MLGSSRTPPSERGMRTGEMVQRIKALSAQFWKLKFNPWHMEMWRRGPGPQTCPLSATWTLLRPFLACLWCFTTVVGTLGELYPHWELWHSYISNIGHFQGWYLSCLSASSESGAEPWTPSHRGIGSRFLSVILHSKTQRGAWRFVQRVVCFIKWPKARSF